MKTDYKMIEQIIFDIMNKLESSSSMKEPSLSPNLLLINATENDSIEILKRDWNVISEQAMSLQLPSNFQEVVFFNCSQDLLVKGALGIADTPESQILAELLLKGKSINLIPSIELEWMTKPDVNELGQSVYISHLLTYKDKLESFGVKLSTLTSFVDAHAKEKCAEHITFHEKLLTEKGVKECQEEEILIRQTTIVTPLARDTARDMGKTIVIV